jgi:hypothetical protein
MRKIVLATLAAVIALSGTCFGKGPRAKFVLPQSPQDQWTELEKGLIEVSAGRSYSQGSLNFRGGYGSSCSDFLEPLRSLSQTLGTPLRPTIKKALDAAASNGQPDAIDYLLDQLIAASKSEKIQTLADELAALKKIAVDKQKQLDKSLVGYEDDFARYNNAIDKISQRETHYQPLLDASKK